MKNNIPCFIPTIITVVAIIIFGLTGIVIGVAQSCADSTVYDESTEDTIESDDYWVVESMNNLLAAPPVSSCVTTPDDADTTKIVETTEATEIVMTETVEKTVYYNVPLNEELQDHIFELSKARGIDPKIIIGMISTESMYNSDAIGDSGRSFGLMQIQPRWHEARMVELGCTDLLNPFENVTVGIDILADLYESSGSMEWALMAYNGGPGHANELAGQGIVSDYVNKVMSITVETYEVFE